MNELPPLVLQFYLATLAVVSDLLAHGGAADARQILEREIEAAEQAAIDGRSWGGLLAARYREVLDRLSSDQDAPDAKGSNR